MKLQILSIILISCYSLGGSYAARTQPPPVDRAGAAAARTQSPQPAPNRGLSPRTQPPPVTSTDRADDNSESCCRLSVYPEGKVWVSGASAAPPTAAAAAGQNATSAGSKRLSRPSLGSSAGQSVNYTLYDPYGLVTKLYAYEVDANGNVLTNRKVFEADAVSMKCPPGYKTESPEHKEMTKSTHAQMFCMQQAPTGQKLKADQWYVLCRERTCTACHLDRTSNTQKYANYVKVESSKIVNNALVVQLSVLEPGMRYNVSLELGLNKESLVNATLAASQSTPPPPINVPNVSDNVYRYPVYVTVVPWPKFSTSARGGPELCSVAARRQLTILPPIKRVGHAANF